MSEDNKIRLTPEQIDEIRSLPVRSAQLGGTQVKGYFRQDEDGEGGLLYIVNDHWEIVRVVRRIRKPEEKEETDTAEKKERTVRPGRIVLPVLLVLAAAAAGFFCLDPLHRRSAPVPTPAPVPAVTASAAPTPAPTSVPTPIPTPAPSPVPSAEPGETIVRAAADLHKGDRVTEASLEPVMVTKEQYSALIQAGSAPVRWEYADTVSDMYVNRFIPCGQYLAVSYFSTMDPVPVNPWSVLPGGYVTLEIPVSDLVPGAIPYYGAKGTLTLWKESETVTTPVPSPEPAPAYETEDPAVYYDVPEPSATPSPAAGVTYETSVFLSQRTERWTVEDVVVTDLRNTDGESLYDIYARMIDMPEVYRRAEFRVLCADPAYLDSVTPITLVLRLTAAQAAAAGPADACIRSLDLYSDAADGDVEATIVNGTMLLQRMVCEFREEGAGQ